MNKVFIEAGLSYKYASVSLRQKHLLLYNCNNIPSTVYGVNFNYEAQEQACF